MVRAPCRRGPATQMRGVTVSPSLAALAGAALVAVVVAFVLRPAQLVPHPFPEPTVERNVERGVPPDRVPALVYVAGAVAHPGVYALPADARARDALAKAGGATHDADLVGVNLAAHVADGDEIAVPREGDARSETPSRSSHRQAHRRTRSGGAQPGAAGRKARRSTSTPPTSERWPSSRESVRRWPGASSNSGRSTDRSRRSTRWATSPASHLRGWTRSSPC